MNTNNTSSVGIDDTLTTESAPTTNNQQNKKVLFIALGILLLAMIITSATKLLSNKANDVSSFEDNQAKEQMLNDTMREAQQQLGDDFYKAAMEGGAPAVSPNAEETVVSVPTEQPVQQQNPPTVAKQNKVNTPNADELVTVNLLTNIGRTDPFVPTTSLASYSPTGLPGVPTVSYPSPPKELIQNETAVKLMETTISGIMFDTFSPSAIVSIEGQDHLVRKGDRINGYKIVNITKDRVIVQNGTNVYRASVGETLTTENAINYNQVYNLEQKFGGASAPKGTKMIQIN